MRVIFLFLFFISLSIALPVPDIGSGESDIGSGVSDIGSGTDLDSTLAEVVEDNGESSTFTSTSTSTFTSTFTSTSTSTVSTISEIVKNTDTSIEKTANTEKELATIYSNTETIKKTVDSALPGLPSKKLKKYRMQWMWKKDDDPLNQ